MQMDNGTKIALAVIAAAVLLTGGYISWQQGWINFGAEEPATLPPQVIIVQPGDTGSSGGAVVQPPAPTTTTPVAAPNGGAVPVEDLRGKAKNKFTMADVSTGNFSFYAPGADVSDPYVLALDVMDLSGGTTTALVIQTQTPYDIFYDEVATYYDDKLTNTQINYNPDTGKGFLMVGGMSFHGVSPVGAFVDVDTLPEVQSGMVDGGTDQINYSEASLGGSGWIRIDIGNANSNTELRDVVMCFRDNDGDMEGTEITALTASYVSGSTAISLPGSLQTQWEDAMGGGGVACMQIANLLGSSQKARWEIAMTVDESAFDVGEEFEISFDDLGDYLEKQYPSRNAKASAETLTVADAS